MKNEYRGQCSLRLKAHTALLVDRQNLLPTWSWTIEHRGTSKPPRWNMRNVLSHRQWYWLCLGGVAAHTTVKEPEWNLASDLTIVGLRPTWRAARFRATPIILGAAGVAWRAGRVLSLTSHFYLSLSRACTNPTTTIQPQLNISNVSGDLRPNKRFQGLTSFP